MYDSKSLIITEIKHKADIREIVSKHVELDKRGFGLCPFHKETVPSFHVVPDKQFFYCFGCGIGGDVIKFVQLYYVIGFRDALKKLADTVEVELPPNFPSSDDEFTDQDKTKAIRCDTVNFYHSQLNDVARQYLTNRGISEYSINDQLIGYAAGGTKLKDHLTNLGYSEDECLEAKVIKKNADGVLLDFFSDRIIIPNIIGGEVVFITGRALRENPCKYLNLPMEIKFLFNEDTRPRESVILCEGPIDAITLNQHGYTAIGLWGVNSRIEEMLKRIETTYTEINLCFDTDEAGRKAILNMGKKLLKKVKIISLPKGEDVNSFFTKYTKEEFDALYKSRNDYLNFMIDHYGTSNPQLKPSEIIMPIIKDLSELSWPEIGDALTVFKNRLDLTRQETDSYRLEIKKLQKNKSKFENGKNYNRNDVLMVADFPELIDLVEDDNNVKFLILANGELSIVSSFVKDGVKLIPPPKQLIPWLLPVGKNVVEKFKLYSVQDDVDRKLFYDLVEYFKSVAVLPNDSYYYLLSSWVLHTYLLEGFHYTPYLAFLAPPERGKSRVGKSLAFVSYRGIVLESLRSANVFRLINDYKSTLFFDLTDVWESARNEKAEDILLSGYESGGMVWRVLYPERGKFHDMVGYKIFGPKIFATNEVPSHVFETRCLTVNMPISDRIFRNNITPQMGLPFKERLLAFRAKHMNEQLPEPDTTFGSRLGNITKPLVQNILLVVPELFDEFIALIKLFEQQRLDVKSDSTEADLIKAIYCSQDLVHNGKLSVATIAEEFNIGKNFREQKSVKSIGWKLRALGFEKTATNDGRRAIIFNKTQIISLINKYGLVYLLNNDLNKINEMFEVS